MRMKLTQVTMYGFIVNLSFLLSLALFSCDSNTHWLSPTVEVDCDSPSLVESYDFKQRTAGIENGVEVEALNWEHEKSGDNYHSVFTDDDGLEYHATTIYGKPAIMVLPNGEWDIFSERIITDRRFPFEIDSVCPDVTRLTFESAETIDNELISTYSVPQGFSDDYEYSNWKLLIKPNGRLFRAIKTEHPGPENIIIETTIEFSGFGEPNVIVDPFPSGTPTPTETPEPTPTPGPDFASARVVTATPTPTSTPTSTPSPTPTPTPMISRIRPDISGTTINVGTLLRLSVDLYDRGGDTIDNSLANGVTFDWSASTGAGTFQEANTTIDDDTIPDERAVLFTAEGVGPHTVTVWLDSSECVGGCGASYKITIIP